MEPVKGRYRITTTKVPKEKPLCPPGETSIFPGCGSPCMNPWTKIISAKTSTNTLATYNNMWKTLILQQNKQKHKFDGSNARYRPKLYLQIGFVN